MKHLAAAFLAVLLAAGLAFAIQAAKKTEGKTHDVKAEFVSGDSDAKTVTVKDAEGNTLTLPVEGKALESLKSFKAGDKVTLKCRDNDKGEHQAISSIEKAT